jgi:hypothetical protein
MTPQELDAALAKVGAHVWRNATAIYHLAGVSLRLGVNAFNVNTFIGAGGIPVPGLIVCNMFPDGNGDLPQPTDGSGVARFQYGASSAFTTPGSGPFTVFATDHATKSEPPDPRVTFGAQLSDVVHSLGDFGGEHTEIYLQFVATPPPLIVPPEVVPVLLAPLEDSVRGLAWRMRGVSWNPNAALYNVAKQRGLGYPLSAEFEFLYAGFVHVAQLYALGVLYCVKGDWQGVHLVAWL